jgi:hypothetical protein
MLNLVLVDSVFCARIAANKSVVALDLGGFFLQPLLMSPLGPRPCCFIRTVSPPSTMVKNDAGMAKADAILQKSSFATAMGGGHSRIRCLGACWPSPTLQPAAGVSENLCNLP